jgi:CubicO group peptidase (beta-lactamase class C family)
VILPRRVFRAVAGSAFALFLAAHGLPAAAGAATPPGAAAEPAFAPAALAAMDAAIDASILAGRAPGGVLWLGRSGIDHVRAHGLRAVEPAAEATTPDTVYDAASLTKVVVTATAVLQQVERGQLILDAPVARWLPAFAAHGKGAITVRHLLTHRSGLRPGLSLQPAWSGRAAALALACAERPQAAPDERFVYSDINFIVLGELVRAVSGEELDRYAARHLFAPLGMVDSGFNPGETLRARIAPTERAGDALLRGVVHDPTARAMGGVAGHAGLFTTAADLARFCRMILADGRAPDGRTVLFSASVAEMTRAQTSGVDQRGLGWDIDTRFSAPRGSVFPAGRSFGHTGFTGTSLWIDPGSRSFVIFLSSRLHPHGKGDVADLRRTLGTLAAEAVGLRAP